MLGFVSENLPQTGAAGINLMGGAGMFAVSIYTMLMGDHLTKLQNNADAAAAGRDILNTTLIIPIVLIIVFAGLNVYMKRKKAATA
jgi:hypothetical protein